MVCSDSPPRSFGEVGIFLHPCWAHQQIDLPTKQLFVRIGVRDKTSNKVGMLEIPLTVAKDSGK
jgi:hypothetical protein